MSAGTVDSILRHLSSILDETSKSTRGNVTPRAAKAQVAGIFRNFTRTLYKKYVNSIPSKGRHSITAQDIQGISSSLHEQGWNRRLKQTFDLVLGPVQGTDQLPAVDKAQYNDEATATLLAGLEDLVCDRDLFEPLFTTENLQIILLQLTKPLSVGTDPTGKAALHILSLMLTYFRIGTEIGAEKRRIMLLRPVLRELLRAVITTIEDYSKKLLHERAYRVVAQVLPHMDSDVKREIWDNRDFLRVWQHALEMYLDPATDDLHVEIFASLSSQVEVRGLEDQWLKSVHLLLQRVVNVADRGRRLRGLDATLNGIHVLDSNGQGVRKPLIESLTSKVSSTSGGAGTNEQLLAIQCLSHAPRALKQFRGESVVLKETNSIVTSMIVNATREIVNNGWALRPLHILDHCCTYWMTLYENNIVSTRDFGLRNATTLKEQVFGPELMITLLRFIRSTYPLSATQGVIKLMFLLFHIDSYVAQMKVPVHEVFLVVVDFMKTIKNRHDNAGHAILWAPEDPTFSVLLHGAILGAKLTSMMESIVMEQQEVRNAIHQLRALGAHSTEFEGQKGFMLFQTYIALAMAHMGIYGIEDSIGRDLSHFIDNPLLHDTKIVGGDGLPLYAHKAVLSARCAIFANRLEEVSAATQDGVVTLSMTSMPRRSLLHLLTYIYQGYVENLTAGDQENLLTVAKKAKMKALRDLLSLKRPVLTDLRTVSADMQEMYLADRLCDVCITGFRDMEGRDIEVRCHRIMLSLGAQYFSAMFHSEGVDDAWQEANTGNVSLGDFNVAVIRACVDILYNMPMEAALHGDVALSLKTELLLQWVMPTAPTILPQIQDYTAHLCEDLIQDGNVLEYLWILSSGTRNDEVLDVYLNCVIRNYSKVQDTAAFQDLDNRTRQMIHQFYLESAKGT
eukprot:Clim_evm8s12 gene=Clim_evmTU8s12